MINRKQSSRRITNIAVDLLKDKTSSKLEKQLAGSVLAQTHTKKQTGADMEELASKVLRSGKYSNDVEDLAASLVSQSNKARHN